jgi:serine/threonine-protein kinase RsbT
VTDGFEVPIRADGDIVVARQKGRVLASRLGFSSSDLTLIATAISELARNILQYAGMGEIVVTHVVGAPRPGLVIIARDKGPGITDLRKALQEGYSTSGGLGLGLPGVRRLMDEFEVASEMGQGTTVTAKKWTRC